MDPLRRLKLNLTSKVAQLLGDWLDLCLVSATLDGGVEIIYDHHTYLVAIVTIITDIRGSTLEVALVCHHQLWAFLESKRDILEIQTRCSDGYSLSIKPLNNSSPETLPFLEKRV